jgi:hypothetical protein
MLERGMNAKIHSATPIADAGPEQAINDARIKARNNGHLTYETALWATREGFVIACISPRLIVQHVEDAASQPQTATFWTQFNGIDMPFKCGHYSLIGRTFSGGLCRFWKN